MQGRFIVNGAKAFNDTVEGVAYNFTKLGIQVAYPRNNPNQLGNAEQLANYGKAENLIQFDKYRGQFPVVIECDYEVTTKGIEIYEVTSITPQLPKPQQQQVKP